MSIESQNQLPQSPNVNYYRAPAFFRSGKIPRVEWPIVIALIVVAAIVGMILATHIIDNYVYADRKHAAAVQASLDAVEPQPLPILTELRSLSSQDLRQALQDKGYALAENPTESAEGKNVDELDVDKLPAQFEQEDIDAVRNNGLKTLPAERAAAYLADSWNLTLYRADATELKMRYCLFGPATIEQAIVKAVEAQGWQGSVFGEAGVDQIGNSYQHGTIELDGRTYRWSVYACPLGDVYSVTGLPDTSWYISSTIAG